MLLGTTDTAFYPRKPFAERLQIIRDYGFDGIDYQGVTATTTSMYKERLEVMEATCREHRNLAAEKGLCIYQVHGPWPTDDTTEEKRAEGNEYFRRCLYATHLLGADKMILHPVMPFGWHTDTPDEDRYRYTVERLKAILPTAEEYGITLCLENMPMRALKLSRMPEIAKCVDEVGSDLVKICWDIGHGHAYWDSDMTGDGRAGGKRIVALHIHDNDHSGDSHLLPGLGNTDWNEVADVLSEIGYNGVCSMELRDVNPLYPVEIQKMQADFYAAVCHDFHNRLSAKLGK